LMVPSGKGYRQRTTESTNSKKMEEKDVQHAMWWAQQTGQFGQSHISEFHELVRMLQVPSVFPRSLRFPAHALLPVFLLKRHRNPCASVGPGVIHPYNGSQNQSKIRYKARHTHIHTHAHTHTHRQTHTHTHPHRHSGTAQHKSTHTQSHHTILTR